MASDQEPEVTKRRDLPSPLVLNLEMEAAQPRILSLFSESFLAWLRDRSASRFSRDAGAPLHVTLEEIGAAADRASTLRLTVTWSQEPPRPAEGLVATHADLPAPRSAAAEPGRFKFFEDTQPQPLVHLEPAPDDAEIAAAVRYAELMRRRPRPVTRKLANKAVILATQSRRHASRVFQAGTTVAARSLLAARRSAARGAILAVRSMHAVRGSASMAVLRFRVRRATTQSPLAALAARVQPSSTSLRVPAIFAAVSVLLVLGTTAFVLLGGRASHDRVGGTVAAQPGAGSRGTPAVEQERREQARADTPRPQKDAQNTTVATQVPTVQVPTVHAAPAFKAVPRPAAIRRTAAKPPAHLVKVRERGPADTRHTTVGTLQVGSEPSGAEVFVNGVSRGRTPLTLRGLPPGSRVVRLDMPGYLRWSWSVAVVANKRTPVSVKLQPDTRRAGVAGDPMDFARVP